MLLGIPRSGISAASLIGELLLGETNTGVGALVGADGALASDAVVVGVAHALTSVSVAATLVGALHDGVGVISVLDISNPGGEFRAGSSRAIGESPGRLAVDSVVASALVVSSASTVTVATIGAVSSNSDDYQRQSDQNELHDFKDY